jgi:heme-degrading monooxygenase HmoA
VLHVRVNVITADPVVLGECVTYIDSEVRPAADSQPGCLGLSLLASTETDVAVLQSLWVSHDALRASELAAMALRGELARRSRGPVTEDQYQVPVFEREAPLPGGEAVRLTRIEVTRPAVDEVIEVFGDTAVPWLAETQGFCGALLFADRALGHLISQTLWRDAQARAASLSTAEVIWADVLESARCVIGAVEDYTLVFSSARGG